jgi:hypothetical protein
MATAPQTFIFNPLSLAESNLQALMCLNYGWILQYSIPPMDWFIKPELITT